MASTAKGVPYPGATSANNVPADMEALAQWVDQHPGVASLTTAQRDGLGGAELWDGRVILNLTGERLERYDATADVWRPATVSDHGALTGLGDDDHPQYLNTARHDTKARHGATVVDHGLIDGLNDNDHPQYLLREEQYGVDAEQNVRLWQLEADVLGSTEGMAGWQGEAFLTGMDNVASIAGDVKITRGTRLGDGSLSLKVDPLAGVSIGDPFMGGYFAGIVDTTRGNIIAADASQNGLRYALIVAPKSLENASVAWKTSQDAAPAAASTRWDGLSATAAMASAAYPAANYCNGLAYPADNASRWYLPAMDELELIYRNLKSTSEANYVYTRTGSTFPGADQPVGYDPSSDPNGAAYTAGNPAQTNVAAFRDGGGQDLGDSGTNLYYWSATEYSATSAWHQDASGSSAGDQGYDGKTSSFRVRPVRRLVL